ncbi:MAG: ABC transporter ATP-binding protein [Armatimonadetes bacterium]|nr:ABC transporter ATP-binding protein [Armatimonadota bacterium]
MAGDSVSNVISARELGHRFQQNWLFRHVELEVKAGDVLVVSGTNGSGKSTLLKVLAGLVRPLEGHVVRPERIGYAAIDLALYPQLSAKEHLELAAQLRGGKTEGLLERVGLPKTGNKPVGSFSTGMRARLKLAMALQHSPELLILDEPTAALDEAGRELIGAVLKVFDGAVILATNDPSDKKWGTHELILD